MILAIDPGKDKTGLAVMDRQVKVAEKKVVKSLRLLDEVNDLLKKFDIKNIIVGDGTCAKECRARLYALPFDIIFVSEKNSSYEARKLYFNDHPPAGILRLIPRGLLFPPVPVDDYAAVVLGRRYLNAINP